METKELTQYDMSEIVRFNKNISEIEKSNIQDRKDGLESLKSALNENLKMYFERVEWLIDGSYGHGAVIQFDRMSKRMNRRAWLFITSAQLEYRTSSAYARKLWHQLDTDLQITINKNFDDIIEYHETKE